MTESRALNEIHVLYGMNLFRLAKAEVLVSKSYDTVVECDFNEADASFDTVRDFGLDPLLNLNYQKTLAAEIHRRLQKTGEYALCLSQRQAQIALIKTEMGLAS